MEEFETGTLSFPDSIYEIVEEVYLELNSITNLRNLGKIIF